MSKELPYFDNPPVVEVVIGTQFEPIPFQFQSFANLPKLFEKEFPTVEQHEPLEPNFENLYDDNFVQNSFGFSFASVPAFPRLWLLNKTRNRLIQLQSDRMVMNWRKNAEDGTIENYPRFEVLNKSFQDNYLKFLADMEANKYSVIPNQIEVSYINLIKCDTEDFTRSMDKVFSFWNNTDGAPLGQAENQAFTLTYKITDDVGMYGRITVGTRTGMNPQGKFLQVTITARGIPRDNSPKGIFEFINLSHEKIVTGFAYLTTEKMHKIWGKK